MTSGTATSTAIAMSSPTDVPRWRKMSKDPSEMISVWRRVCSAIGPSTSAITRAAGDMPTRRMKKPSTPQASMIPTSTMLSLIVYVPSVHSTITIGASTLNWTRARLAKAGMQKMLISSSIALPRYMLAIRPQAKSGFCSISSGPGCRPHIRKPPSSTALAAELGMPSVSSGTIAPAVAALLAASGPARPAMAPLPNFSGVLETDFSTLYDISDATVAPAPGVAPTKKPRNEPRRIGHRDSRRSCRVGQKPLPLRDTEK